MKEVTPSKKRIASTKQGQQSTLSFPSTNQTRKATEPIVIDSPVKESPPPPLSSTRRKRNVSISPPSLSPSPVKKPVKGKESTRTTKLKTTRPKPTADVYDFSTSDESNNDDDDSFFEPSAAKKKAPAKKGAVPSRKKAAVAPSKKKPTLAVPSKRKTAPNTKSKPEPIVELLESDEEEQLEGKSGDDEVTSAAVPRPSRHCKRIKYSFSEESDDSMD